ncbi:MAG: hypothetical protein HC877_22345 [Thioploca sp.]|nr:hypothetical protein [Thioploca sp.]
MMKKITAIKEELKYLSGGFKDVITEERAKIRYCLYLLETRGGPVSEE